jgi:transcriptional regulator with XRE-family HTH domain
MRASKLGQNVLLLRRDQKLSQQKLANKTGISANTIARLERGDIQKIYSDNLNRLADALQVSSDYLLGRTGESSYER